MMLNTTHLPSLNSSWLNSTLLNSSLPTEVTQVDLLTVGTVILAGTLILLFNGVVISVLFFNRPLLKESFSVHILTLCVTDFSVGLLSIPIITAYIYNQAMAYAYCAASIGSILIGQCASLYHVLGICIYRVLVLRKNEQPPKWKQRYLHYHVPSVWILSILALSFPFVFWGQLDSIPTVCTVDTLFGQNFTRATTYIMGCYIPGLALTDILYIYLKVLLYKHEQQVSANFQNRRQTHTTIGIILGLFNVFLLPFIVSFTTEAVFESFTPPRKVRSAVLSWAMLNSILNPMVYAGRIKSLRDCVLAPFRYLLACRCVRNGCVGPVAPMPNGSA